MEQVIEKTISFVEQHWLVSILLFFGANYVLCFASNVKTAEELTRKLNKEKSKYDALLDKYNRLAVLINSKGGWEFLEGNSTQFSPGEIKNLIKLCHPDKHGGDVLAKEMTAKLLEVRKHT